MNKPVRKAFSNSLYNKYDAPARNALVFHLEKQGHTILKNEENFNVDVVSEKEGKAYFNEVEVKTAWRGDWNTNWREIRLPERKQRLLDKHEGKGDLNFYIFRPDFKQAWLIRHTQLTQESLREAHGPYIKKGEQFFHIPFTEAELVTL